MTTPAMELVRIVIGRWLLATVSFVILTGIGLIWLARQTPSYEVEAIVAEKKDNLSQSANGLSSLTGGLLGLKQQSSGINALQEAVYSAELADSIVRKYHIDHEIFRDRWDPQLKRWKPATGLASSVSNAVKSMFGAPTAYGISSTDVQQYLRDIVFIKSDIDDNNSIIRFYYPNRLEGRHILDIVLKEADNQIRDQQRGQTEDRLRYLYTRLRQAHLVEQATMLVSMIQRLETQNAIISADQTFSTDVLSAPRASLQVKRPRYTLVLGIIIVVAGLLTLAIVWSVAIIRRR